MAKRLVAKTGEYQKDGQTKGESIEGAELVTGKSSLLIK